MRRLAALIIGVATAQPDIDVACRRPTYQSDDDDCVDDEDWSYVTKEGDVCECDHVAKKPEKRCGRVGDGGVVASEACPKTCGTC